MALTHAYSTANTLTGLATTAFVWSNGATANRGYLNDGRMDKVFSVGSVASGVNVIIDTGSSQGMAAVAILNSNIYQATAPTITIKASDDPGMAGAVTVKAASTPNASAPRHKDHFFQAASVTKRYVQILWTWTGSFTLTIGELWVCVPVTLSRYVPMGHGEREEYVNTKQRMYTGEARGHFIAGPYRTKTLPFFDLSATERNELLTMFRATKGGSSPMLWSQQYEATATAADDDHQDVIFGKLEEDGLAWREPDYLRFEVDNLVIRSLAREVGA